MTLCSCCGAEIKDKNNFCSKCGAPKPQITICNKCGEKLSVDDLFCGNCGHPIEKRSLCTLQNSNENDLSQKAKYSNQDTKSQSVCSKCGSSVPRGESQCPKCGSIFIIYNQEKGSSQTIKTNQYERQNQVILDKNESAKSDVPTKKTFLEEGSNVNSNEVDFGVVNNLSLADQLKLLSKSVASLEKIMGEIDNISRRINDPVKAEPISRGRAMRPFIIPGCILCGISLMFLNESTVGIFAVLILTGLAIIGLGFYFSDGRVAKSVNVAKEKYDADLKEQTKLTARLSELELEKNKTIDQIQQLMVYDGTEIGIPDSYFYSDAIAFFADRIVSGRSSTLGEAMDAYDEYIHRMKLEQAAFEATEYQRQSADNIAAIQRESAAIRRQGAINTALHVANTIRHWD